MGVPLTPMIPAMPPWTECHRRATLALLGVLSVGLVLSGCVAPPAPGEETPLLEGLALYGTSTEYDVPDPDAPEVIVVKDRHTIHGAITRERGPLMRVRRENRGVVAFLIHKGYDLLGCEAPYGPLPHDDGPSAAHRAAVLRALETNDVLDQLTVYQPIRYEEEFRGRIDVIGMEDPTLYDADAARLEQIQKLRNAASRADLTLGKRRDAVRSMMTLVNAISKNSHQRGRAAGCNLLEHMWLFDHQRAVLVIGGAHASAAVQSLHQAGARTILFECTSYDDRGR